MGNVPSRWVARVVALVVGAALAAVAYGGGSAVAGLVANGFAFDWYRHAAVSSFSAGETVLAAGLFALGAAAVALLLVTGPTAGATRWASRRLRYVPPRYSAPEPLGVHGARLALVLPAGCGLLAALLAYVLLQAPVVQGAAAIGRVSPGGYALLAAGGAAFGAGVAALVAVLSTFSGVASGRIARDAAARGIVARVVLFGHRHAGATVALALAFTVVGGYFASTLTVASDVNEAIPRGDALASAPRELAASLPSGYPQQVTLTFHVVDLSNTTQRSLYDKDNASHVPNRRTDADPGNISDEVYVRALDEAVAFFTAQPPFVASSGASDLYKLVNWTYAGGDSSQPGAGNASFAIPDASPLGELQYRNLVQGFAQVPALSAALANDSSPDGKQTSVQLTVDPSSTLTPRQVGDAAMALRDAWIRKTQSDPSTFKVFGADNPPQLVATMPVADAHASALAQRDALLLVPIVAVFVAAALYVALRTLVGAVVGAAVVLAASAWTFGALGALGVPIDGFMLMGVPLLAAVGVLFGMLPASEYASLRQAGGGAEDAWAAAGSSAGLALVVAALTALVAAGAMAASPSLPLARLGLGLAVAAASSLVLSLLLVPALVTLLERATSPARHHPARIMPALATGVSRARWIVLVVLVLLAAAGASTALALTSAPDGPAPRGWVATDPVLHGSAAAGASGATQDVFLFQGDLTDPAAHKYVANVTQTLLADARQGSWTDAAGRSHASLVVGGSIQDLPTFVGLYVNTHGGIPGQARLTGAQGLAQALAPLGQGDPTQTPNYPQTQADVKAALDAAAASPLRRFEVLLVDPPRYDTAVTSFQVRSATPADDHAAWSEAQSVLARNEALRPAGLRATFYGDTAIAHLASQADAPWLQDVGVATAISGVALALLLTRDLRATLAVAACDAAALALWLGVLALPPVGVGLTLRFASPLVLLLVLGNACALHLALRWRRTRDTRDAFAGVGNAVLFVSLAAAGAFLVFTQVGDQPGRDAMLGGTLAAIVVLFVTIAAVPVVYPVRRQRSRREDDRNVPVVDAQASGARGQSAAPPASADAPSGR